MALSGMAQGVMTSIGVTQGGISSGVTQSGEVQHTMI